MGKYCSQVTASLRIVLVSEADIRQAGLSFLRHFGGKLLPAGQAAEQPQRIRMASELVKVSSLGEDTISQIERPAHDAASLQRVERFQRVRRARL
jgi:hypothetical protein